MMWVTRTVIRQARCFQTRVASNRIYHVSAVTRQEVPIQQTPAEQTVEAAPHDAPVQAPDTHFLESAVQRYDVDSHPETAPANTPKSDLTRPPPHTISTLNPAQLSETDYVDLSNRSCELALGAKLLTISYMGSRLEHTVFPYGTHGFFYLARAPGLPLLASELRFRVTYSSSPASFELGHDLTLSYGLPWSMSFLSLLRRKAWRPLLDTLCHDKATITQLVHAYHGLFADQASRRDLISRVVHSWKQPFVFHFEKRVPESLWLLGKNGPSKLQMDQVFNAEQLATHNDWRRTNGNLLDIMLPVDGCAIFRFESVSEELATVRCLRIIRPLTYPTLADIKRPQLHMIPGQLLRIRRRPRLTIPLKRTALLECAAPNEDPEELLELPSTAPTPGDVQENTEEGQE